MASGTIGDSGDDLNWRARRRWTEYSKVYTRKFYKKAQKNSNNKDTAATTTSSAENPIAAAGTSENPTTNTTTTTTISPTKVSSATVASPATTEAATTSNSTSTSEDPKDSAAASTPLIPPDIHAATTPPHGNVGYDVVQESQETLVAKDAHCSKQKVLEQSLNQEQSPSRSSVDKNVDYSLQKPQLQEQLQHEEHMPSLSEDNCSSQHQAQEGSGSQNSELQNHEDSPVPNRNDAKNLKEPSPIYGPNEIVQTSGEGPHNLRSSENGLPNGSEVVAAQFLVGNDSRNDGELIPVPPQLPNGNELENVNGVVEPLVISKVDDRVRFKLAKATQKDEIQELRKKLECELDQVRRLSEQLEVKELQLASYNTRVNISDLSNSSNYIGTGGGNIDGHSYQPQHARTDQVDRRMLVRVSSEMGAAGHQEIRPMGLPRVNSDVGMVRNLEPRPYSRQLSVAVMENKNRVGDFVEKEKRTPKANQYYRNSEFLLGKDRLPPESIKRSKSSNGRKHSGETEHAFRFGFGFDKSRNQVFRSCSSLLQRLMKHKHGWVFNEPVDAKAMGLVDYHDIIKHPMDLGTIKTRLSQNWYKSPREFAEDVRLVFRNAMTYNPKGQDVHIMAEELSQIFEERWAKIETEYNPYWKYQMYQDAGLPTPTSRKAPPQSHFAPPSVPVSAPVLIPSYAPAAPQVRTSDRPETMATPMAVDPKFQRPHVGRIPVPKKPKAKDPNKRDMSYEEKQRLSTNLQSLPPEKLDAILQIIKKRNTALSQHDDEIEVDIDKVDIETLWELDRFVTNYKKSLSKIKRKAELAHQARSVANQTVALTNTTTAIADGRVESGTAFERSAAPPAVEDEKQRYNGRSSSSSSSSSDSGSSSSDSDSDSSSTNGSDAGNSPGT